MSGGQFTNASGGGIAVNILGNNNIVNARDPQFISITQALLRKQTEQDEAIRAQSEQIAGLRIELAKAVSTVVSAARRHDAPAEAKHAVTALEHGNTGPSQKLLRKEENTAAKKIGGDRSDVAMQRHRAAEFARQQGALAYLTNVRAALEAFERAAGYEPDDVRTQIYIGDLQTALGETDDARKTYTSAISLATKATALSPDDPAAQHDLAISHARLGEVLALWGDQPAALSEYRQALSTAENLAEHDPNNPDWQRELAMSHDRIGGVLKVQGNLDGALGEYRKDVEIDKALVRRDPANQDWQRDLAASHIITGEVLHKLGDFPDALREFREAQKIVELLAGRDKNSTRHAQDYSISHYNTNDVLMAIHAYIAQTSEASNDFPSALVEYQHVLSIAQSLAKQDPNNVDWQHDEGLSHEEIGGILKMQGDLDGALSEHRQALEIAKRLVLVDSKNTDWGRELAACHDSVGDVLKRQHDFTGALQEFRDGIGIIQSMADLDPTNTDLQRDLSESHGMIGALLADQNDVVGARKEYQSALLIAATLYARNPANIYWKDNLVSVCTDFLHLNDLGENPARSFPVECEPVMGQ
ncbi:tetratricopeptide repeat protein [Paraburkholderia nemoris]|uniref:tetratricopeptide repeat protein n=1 Tax=Paraburkholderia nemoris TaxID=2793076 RepID=UPI0038B767DC